MIGNTKSWISGKEIQFINESGTDMINHVAGRCSKTIKIDHPGYTAKFYMFITYQGYAPAYNCGTRTMTFYISSNQLSWVTITCENGYTTLTPNNTNNPETLLIVFY